MCYRLFATPSKHQIVQQGREGSPATASMERQLAQATADRSDVSPPCSPQELRPYLFSRRVFFIEIHSKVAHPAETARDDKTDNILSKIVQKHCRHWNNWYNIAVLT